MKSLITTVFAACLSTVSLAALAANTDASPLAYGSPVAENTTQPVRQINLNNGQSVDVQKGEVVELVSGSAHEEWKFDGVQPEFTLAHVFPAADHANSIRVYVADPDHQD
ncbi:CzcE family metal-binding protein [Amantichitinum ursilacus]|uniref:Heavy-metal resistance protein CzcE n=1 Tax=Amantichitinum ursilacus TaxID=857265 RepID=A0A0N0XFY9_9NEIS|nr:CzcE family metal-binding protein [Amantichitinum ursilacus]KPC49582.1 hypothetical protein WG78_19700 [Amantichitinum ursilacus]